LQAYPDQRGNLGGAPWVVIVGNRRLTASQLAGRSSIDVRVAADLDTAEDLEDRILIENIQRKDLPPLLEAEHLQRRLGRPGQTTRSVGAAIGKSHAYVQQRVDLLKMIPEFRELFRTGEINLKIGRKLGSLNEGEQRSRLAAGPPYSPTDVTTGARPAKPAGGNPVSTTEPLSGSPDSGTAGSAAIPRQSRPVDSFLGGNPVSTEAPMGNGSDSASSSSNGRPEARDPQPAQSDEYSAVTEPQTNQGSHPDPQPTHDDLETVRVSVSQWLDSALAELDSALERDSEDQLSNALAETQSHILAAREALVRARG
ncbi:MAG: hypothetical protein ACRDHG_12900, partial [Anaerolineales bacterium]